MNDPISFIEPLGGLAIDLADAIKNRPFVPHSLTKLRNINFCRNVTNARTAIEIGSYKGVTTHRLARFFANVISVEIDARLHQIAKKRCKNDANVELLLGDGTVMLPEISARVGEALLFLDGHFSGPGTGVGAEPEPVLRELDLIQPNLHNFVAIVIDDFRLFGVESGWPKKSELFAKLESTLSSDWYVGILNDQVIALHFGNRPHGGICRISAYESIS